MHKLIITIFLFFYLIQQAFCALSPNDINIVNLKEKSLYMLELKDKALDIKVSDNEMLDISPMSSINNEGKLLFVNSNKSGVCDVNIKTEKEEYKIRFISGSTFEDSHENLIKIDLPLKPEKEIN